MTLFSQVTSFSSKKKKIEEFNPKNQAPNDIHYFVLFDLYLSKVMENGHFSLFIIVLIILKVFVSKSG